MSSETTPLVPNPQQTNFAEYYDDDGYSIYSQATNKKRKIVKYVIYAASAIVVIPLCYFLLVFLPNLAPPAATLPDLVKINTPDIYLHPISPPPKKSKRKKSLYEAVDTLKETFDQQPDDEFDDDTVQIDKAPIDDDSPFTPVPNFKDWEMLGKNSPLFKKHFKKFNKNTLNTKPAKRMIMIGDIHGSLNELLKLLKNINYDGGKHDHVIMLGDFLAKGKNSIGVLDWAIENHIGCILGNHELEILKRYAQFHALPPLSLIDRNETVLINSNKDSFHTSESYDLDDLMRIAKRLTPEHIGYLSTCPIIQELGPVPHFTNKKQTKPFQFPANGVAVHGGLLWHLESLEDQEVDDITSIRSLLPPDWKKPTDDRHAKVDGVKAEPWTKHWMLHQRKLVADSMKNLTGDELTLGTKVYYGHDAGRGLTFKEFSTGLDSGCVYGAQLTAEIVWSEVVVDKKSGEDSIVYKRMLTQVNC